MLRRNDLEYRVFPSSPAVRLAPSTAGEFLPEVVDFGVDLFQSLHRCGITQGGLADRAALCRLQCLDSRIDHRGAALDTANSGLDLPALADVVPFMITRGRRRPVADHRAGA